MPVSRASELLPTKRGKYAFFVDSRESLPNSFREDAGSRPIPRPIYLGKADVGLLTRVWKRECQHLKPATMFRSIGAMLGYRSPDGGRNYEVSSADKRRVTDGIAAHLLVAWRAGTIVGTHATAEEVLIHRYTSLLNILHNPRKSLELCVLRTVCRAGQVQAR